MAKVTGSASLGMKLGLGHKKSHDKYDNANPHHSVTIERTYPDDLTDEQLIEKAESLHKLCRNLVEKKMQSDIKDAQKSD